MELKEIRLEARNKPELFEKIKSKFCVEEVKDINRKFLRFEGVNFVYKYRVKILVRQRMPICQKCGNHITTKPAWVQCMQVCNKCFLSLKSKKPIYNTPLNY